LFQFEGRVNCIFWHSWNCASWICPTRWSVNQQFYSHVPQCLREGVCKNISSQQMAHWTLIFHHKGAPVHCVLSLHKFLATNGMMLSLAVCPPTDFLQCEHFSFSGTNIGTDEEDAGWQ
jgi:hypothetical protein